MTRTCSHCGNNGHNCRTCTDASGSGGPGGGDAPQENGIMLFGVRLTAVNSFRKSASMTNLSQFDQQPQDSNADAGYVSDDVVHASGRSRERKRGVPWSEEEHRLFLLGLQKVGKGDWRGISRNFVKTRTPTQVASHAQKYFLRRHNQNRRRRRSSLFDITTDTVMESSSTVMVMDDETVPPTHPQSTLNYGGKIPRCNLPMTVAPMVPSVAEKPIQSLSIGGPRAKPIRPTPILPVPPSSKLANLSLMGKTPVDPLPLSLKLPTPPASSGEQSPASSHSSTFEAMSGKYSNSGDSIISVA